MAHGFPDFTGWEGRSGVGIDIVNYSFSFAVGAGATVGVAIPASAAGTKQVFQFVCVSVPDDTAIHLCYLDRAADAWVFWISNFITTGEFNFPGQGMETPDNARLWITNNTAGALTFAGTIGWTVRAV